MMDILIKPTKLKGKLNIPPSKSLSHRAVICASLCKGGESIIKNLILSEDIKATVEGMKRLIDKHIHNLVIDCKESGSTLRFLIPISIVLNNQCRFKGSPRLFERPLDIYFDIFNEQNITYKTSKDVPLYVKGNLKAGTYKISGKISSQFISGLFFALPLLSGDSNIIISDSLESRSYVNMTIDVMEKFGVIIKQMNANEFYIRGNQNYISSSYTIEADYSQASFFLAANELGNNIDCLGLNDTSLQGDKEIVDIIKRYKSAEREIVIDASQIPDLVPIISVLASLKNGLTTKIINAGRLRIKESDRLKAISTEMKKIGADINETEDGLIINGVEKLSGGTKVSSWNDHRIAMSLAIAATNCEKEIILENCQAVNKSYPTFWDDYKYLGGEINELNNR
ncbi:3-phosphoshikimate 1-carboxyvinyltransferase [Sedimentibacter hydroxybenzoicus DSM 7310]|uniref:3-phosphoshikimate 1-carboxyvinyltransferase n=1 Tax=Sedimentibacter hydroxybenzoicus DSM 7310 TaxID=1123245 RepID=A0A974GWK1_SEDHY|nr:3-phosphoshikimate 1-carboxyvinyltransferase [Sedimentibacter hydroxybenzoicus]NYB74574.1 3-phosphoshikimate 1-carboxyvinyltransferase [Sedimentibacter hydroxybenzoicus DSM 7310]